MSTIKYMRCALMIMGLFLTNVCALASDTLFFKSPNGRYDSKLIRKCEKEAYSDYFIQMLFESKQGREYLLFDSILVIDNKDTLKIPQHTFKIGFKYVSANICFHQRNYILQFAKINNDTFTCTLDVLTDYKIKTQIQFNITLQPSILMSNGNLIYKDPKSNLKITASGEDTIILENLFLDNEPCPRTIMFIQ